MAACATMNDCMAGRIGGTGTEAQAPTRGGRQGVPISSDGFGAPCRSRHVGGASLPATPARFPRPCLLPIGRGALRPLRAQSRGRPRDPGPGPGSAAGTQPRRRARAMRRRALRPRRRPRTRGSGPPRRRTATRTPPALRTESSRVSLRRRSWPRPRGRQAFACATTEQISSSRRAVPPGSATSASLRSRLTAARGTIRSSIRDASSSTTLEKSTTGTSARAPPRRVSRARPTA